MSEISEDTKAKLYIRAARTGINLETTVVVVTPTAFVFHSRFYVFIVPLTQNMLCGFDYGLHANPESDGVIKPVRHKIGLLLDYIS